MAYEALKGINNVDANAFKSWAGPMLVSVLGGLGKYIVAPLAALTGVQETQVGNWWIGTATILGAVAVALLSSWLTTKKVQSRAAAATDEKLAGDGNSPVITLPPKE